MPPPPPLVAAAALAAAAASRTSPDVSPSAPPTTTPFVGVKSPQEAPASTATKCGRCAAGWSWRSVSARVGNTCMLEQEEPDTLLLKLTRSLQVAVMLLFIVAVTIAMVNLSPAVQHIYRATKQQQSQGAWAAADATFNELVLCLALGLGLAVPSLALSLVWLIFTACPRTRTRSCGGRLVCTRFTCDVAWDIVFTFVWAVVLCLSCVAADIYTGCVIRASAVLASLAFGLHITSAALSSSVRKRMQSAAATAAAAVKESKHVAGGDGCGESPVQLQMAALHSPVPRDLDAAIV